MLLRRGKPNGAGCRAGVRGCIRIRGSSHLDYVRQHNLIADRVFRIPDTAIALGARKPRNSLPPHCKGVSALMRITDPRVCTFSPRRRTVRRLTSVIRLFVASWPPRPNPSRLQGLQASAFHPAALLLLLLLLRPTFAFYLLHLLPQNFLVCAWPHQYLRSTPVSPRSRSLSASALVWILESLQQPFRPRQVRELASLVELARPLM